MQETSYELVEGDVCQTIQKYPQKFQLIIADPPFGIEYSKGSHYSGLAGSTLYEDQFNRNDYIQFSHQWISACEQALTDNGSLYIIIAWNRLHEIFDALELIPNLTMINHIIWGFPFGIFCKKMYVTSHYHILFLVKNSQHYTFNRIHKTSIKGEPYEEDLWNWHDNYRAKSKLMPEQYPEGHPCQLPPYLIDHILSISSNPNDWVGDVFAGSGTTTLECRKMQRNVVAFEKNPDYIPIIRKKARFGENIEVKKDSLLTYFK
mgnify:CR=1 FL=1